MSALLGLSSIEILALIAITFVAGLVRGFSGFALSAMVMASAVLILPIVLLIDQPWTLATPSQASIWSVLLLAILCTAIAYLLFFQILANAGAVNVSLVTFLVPPSAIVLGIIVLDETLELHHIIGMGIIMAGLIVIDGRLLKK